MHAHFLKGKDNNLNKDTSLYMLQGFSGMQPWDALLYNSEWGKNHCRQERWIVL